MEKAQRQILAALLEEPKTYWELVTAQNRHLSWITKTLNQMVKDELIEWSDRVKLTEKGRRLAETEGTQHQQRVACNHCGKRTVVRQGIFNKAYEKIKEILPERPGAIADYDQGPIDPECLIARIMVMYERGDLEGQKLFVLGDDDLTSLAAAFTGLPAEIAVVEIDDRLVEFIDATAKKEGLTNLTVHKYDVRSALPDQFKNRYDTFMVDPVETLSGILLFMTRCVESLKEEGDTGYFGLTHLEASRRKWHQIQKSILDMNFVVTDILHNFHWYELDPEAYSQMDYPMVTEAPGKLQPPQHYWYSSNFYRIEAVGRPKPLQFERIPGGRELYFDDESYATLP